MLSQTFSQRERGCHIHVYCNYNEDVCTIQWAISRSEPSKEQGERAEGAIKRLNEPRHRG